MAGVYLYIFAVIGNAVNLFMQVYFAVMYSDLEADFINPIDLCNKLNVYILPEAILSTFIGVLMLINLQFISFLLNLPLILFNVNKYRNDKFKLDATEIFRKVNSYKIEAFAKLAFHLILFFYYLYSMIVSIVD
jgi:hypothetical protein